MRQGGSEPRVGQGTGVQHKALMFTGTDVHRSHTGLLHAAWKRKQLLLRAIRAGALLQTQHCVKPLNIFSHLMLKKNPERQVFYPQFTQESFKAQSSKMMLANAGLGETGVCQGCSFSTCCTGQSRDVSLVIQVPPIALPPEEWILSLWLGSDNFLLCPKSKNSLTTEQSSPLSTVLPGSELFLHQAQWSNRLKCMN